jgi:hypothetical protein
VRGGHRHLRRAGGVGAPPAGTFDGVDTPASGFGETAWKVAVDEAGGDVYVLDPDHDVVDRFSSTGAYLSRIDGAGTAARSFGFSGDDANDVAVDNSGGDAQDLVDGGGEARPPRARAVRQGGSARPCGADPEDQTQERPTSVTAGRRCVLSMPTPSPARRTFCGTTRRR